MAEKQAFTFQALILGHPVYVMYQFMLYHPTSTTPNCAHQFYMRLDQLLYIPVTITLIPIASLILR